MHPQDVPVPAVPLAPVPTPEPPAVAAQLDRPDAGRRLILRRPGLTFADVHRLAAGLEISTAGDARQSGLKSLLYSMLRGQAILVFDSHQRARTALATLTALGLAREAGRLLG